MKKCFVLLIVLLSSVFCFADDINMVGDPPHEQGGNGNRGQTLLPTVDYTNGEVTIFVPYQIDDSAKEMHYLLNINNHHARFQNLGI